jgi:hypothetical protein
MHGPEVLIPLVFFLATGAIFGTFLLTRHKERMTMIDKGMKAEDIKSLYVKQSFQANPLASLKWGIVLVCIGTAIILGMWLRNSFMYDEGIFPALICAFGGLGLVIFYLVANKKAQL